MINGIEASIVAQEILYLIEDLEKKYKNKPDALEVLDIIRKTAEGIKAAGDGGWY